MNFRKLTVISHVIQCDTEEEEEEKRRGDGEGGKRQKDKSRNARIIAPDKHRTHKIGGKRKYKRKTVRRRIRGRGRQEEK